MIAGRATAEGTARYAARARQAADGHFRDLDGLAAPSLGVGTYLGLEDDATDALYQQAVDQAVARGISVIDTAINYRHQRSERAIGAALADLLARRVVARDEVIVATKGGYIPFDREAPADAGAYFSATYLRPRIVGPGDVVGGSHCMTPRYLADQIARSRANLGLATIDVYYVHNPEGQLAEVDGAEFTRRIRAAFGALEQAVSDGAIARYGTATWNGYRQPPGAADLLSLEALVTVAREVGGPDHHFKVIQLPYNLAMPEAFVRANQRVGDETVSALEAARRLGVYVMASASVYQGQLTRNLPPVIAEFLPGLATNAQRALQFVRSTPGVGTALVGMKSVAHVEENARVAATAPIPWSDFQRLFSEA
ncbi:MAG: aldo/keto reductase [Candidatus Rokubacteria bacterium]|nr:aldo/keto reductase [Candidatus Rokubacteria bacterium]MBI3826619.1 aldo/keto reductase [Candidatus Rokubacteria bacterium]